MKRVKAGEKIVLNGSYEGRRASYNPTIHVFLTDGYYRKDDVDFVVGIGGRYFRKESPLIQQLYSGYYGPEFYAGKDEDIHQDDAGNWGYRRDMMRFSVLKKEKEINSKTGGKFSLSDALMLPIGRRWYLHLNGSRYSCLMPETEGLGNIEDIAKFAEENYGLLYTSTSDGNCFCLERDVVKIHPAYGSKNYRLKSDTNWVVHDGYALAKQHAIHTVELSGKRGKDFSHFKVRNERDRKTTIVKVGNFESIPVVTDDLANIVISNYKSYKSALVARNCTETDVAKYIYRDLVVDRVLYHRLVSADSCKGLIKRTIWGFVCRKEYADLFDEMYSFVQNSKSSSMSRVALGKKLMGTSFIPKEEMPELYLGGWEQETGGDYVWHKVEDFEFEKEVPSPTLRATGGIGYTFGVELETSYGHMAPYLCEHHKVDAVGDRSIGSLEYVTKPLHGDKGINKLRNLITDLNRFTATDDRCGIHVHVGGSNLTDSPVFNRRFSVLAIMLGCQIERELFSMLPPNRMESRNSNGQAYCGSILNFADTDFSNGRKRLREFVFADDADSDFDRSTNSRTQLHRWTSSRYKWLNLVNCNTNNNNRRGGGFRTIEFRAFDGSTNPNDVHAFVLISLAFVSLIENHPRVIKRGGVTLTEMAELTLRKDARIFLTEWMESRKSIIKQFTTKKAI